MERFPVLLSLLERPVMLLKTGENSHMRFHIIPSDCERLSSFLSGLDLSYLDLTDLGKYSLRLTLLV